MGAGSTGFLREGGQLQPLDAVAGAEAEKEKEKRDKAPGREGSSLERRTSVVLGAVGSGLKQRLQAAVSGSH